MSVINFLIIDTRNQPIQFVYFLLIFTFQFRSKKHLNYKRLYKFNFHLNNITFFRWPFSLSVPKFFLTFRTFFKLVQNVFYFYFQYKSLQHLACLIPEAVTHLHPTQVSWKWANAVKNKKLKVKTFIQ